MTTAGAAGTPHHRRAGLSAMLGQSIEFYDFFLYGTAAAVTLGRLFFPSTNPAAATLAAFATYAAGFLMRPLGAVVFGHFGDRIGRKRVLVLTLVVMGGSTTVIGALPTYADIGVWAPILLVTLRCAQGVAIGGEWGGASLVSVEHAPRGRAVFYGSIAQLGSSVGLLLSTVMVLLFNLLPEQAFRSWGWRVPFLLSAVGLVIGLIIRLRMRETPAFTRMVADQQRSRLPIVDVLRTAARPLLIGMTVTLLTSGGFVLINTVTISYTVDKLGLDRDVGLIGQILNATVAGSLIVLVGHWVGKRQPRLVAGLGAAMITVWAVPLYLLINTGESAAIWTAQAIATLFGTLMSAVLPTLLASQFPAQLRYTGVSVCYQIGNAIGGLVPLLATYAITATDSWWPLAVLLMTLGAMSTVGCLAAKGNTLTDNSVTRLPGPPAAQGYPTR